MHSYANVQMRDKLQPSGTYQFQTICVLQLIAGPACDKKLIDLVRKRVLF
jgi:hypothetical protein